MSEYLTEIISVVLIPFFGILGTMIGKLIIHLTDKIKNEHLQGFANVAVRWASQKMRLGNQGAEKYQVVSSKIADKFDWVTEDQIEEAIESAVNGLKREVGNAEGLDTQR